MKYLLSILILSLSTICAQNKSIKGTIRDYSTGEPLPFANVVVKNSSGGITADENGEYELNLTPARYDLLFTYIGYKTETVPVDVSNTDIELNIALTSTGVLLQEVSVYASDKSDVNSISSLSLQSKQWKKFHQ